jgi:hypothetical protein
MYPSTRLVAIFSVFLSLGFIYSIFPVTTRDPTSLFFNPRKGYAPRYSAVRQQQAEVFVSSYNSTREHELTKSGYSKKSLCVGIPSVARQGTQYLRNTLGSLLADLTMQERQEIYILVFLPHSRPSVHPAYGEDWLSVLADLVLTYEVEDDEMQHIRDMEAEGGMFTEKGLYDYSYLLSACAEQHTPYIAIIEDDAIAMDGWYHRTMKALWHAEEQSMLRRGKPGFLYLRLFYTEAFLGWNSENWRTYLYYSGCAGAIPIAIYVFLRATKVATKFLEAISTRRAVVSIYAVIIMLILLFFALGRMTVLPMPFGVHEMPQFGCCSQALVFPRTKALELVSYFRYRRTGFVDVLTEDYANEKDELRFTITPSVVQHVGRTSSKMNNYGPIMKRKIWSFNFEKYDELELWEEHKADAAAREKEDSSKPFRT